MRSSLDLIIVIFISYLAVFPSYAKDQLTSSQQQLENISKLVAEIEEKLQKNLKDQKVVDKEMVKLDREIGRLHQQISATKQQISDSRDELHKFEKQTIALNQKIGEHADQFKQQIRLAYVAKSQTKWKILLSQNSLQNIGRNAVIYDYIHHARAEQINHMQQLVTQARENKQAEQQEYELLQNLLNKHTNAQEAIEKVRNDKQAIQANLSQRIASESAQLTKQKAQQAKLKKLITTLNVKQAKGKFTQQKGKLHWPTQGKIKYKFGDARLRSSGTRWSGTLISTRKGTEIKAIYPGTVVFSDWFDHYGWLIIIDHGDGYMSLYAHAEGLYKSIDEKVSKGELIALVGDSGDINQAGLYFEIRRQGAPVDPASWCVYPNMAYSP